jgi:hypothetical protein
MTTNIEVGDKVVCTASFRGHPQRGLFNKMPQKGWVYVVEEVSECETFPVGIRLLGIKCKTTLLFNPSAFRRIGRRW